MNERDHIGPRYRWEDYIKINLKGTGWEDRNAQTVFIWLRTGASGSPLRTQ